MGKELEEGVALTLDFTKLKKVANCGVDVIPVVAQDATTKDIVVVAYVNEEALQHSLKTRTATFWSTSRNELWVKGATSGDYLDLVDVRVNCEQNSLLYLVKPRGVGACHTKDSEGKSRSSCYYRHVTPDGAALEFLPGYAPNTPNPGGV
uniref:phosphoribosyl-AMP cyclohydrolase n=1 Tax=Eutreptiella gymnastica TaxID=73025 RepID=A0A7S4C8W8_9EUGL